MIAYAGGTAALQNLSAQPAIWVTTRGRSSCTHRGVTALLLHPRSTGTRLLRARLQDVSRP